MVGVLGCGPVGLCTIMGLRALGAGEVFAFDRDRDRLALAEGAGATPIHVDERNPVTVLADATDGRGADAVIDAVGHLDAFHGAVDAVRRGGIVVVIGVYSSEVADVQLGTAWARGLTFRFAGLTPVLPWWEQARLGRTRRGRSDAADQPSAAARGGPRGLPHLRSPRGDEGDPAAVNVTVGGEEPSGLASMLAELIRTNLSTDPGRAALLRPSVVVLDAPDAEVTVFLRSPPPRRYASGTETSPTRTSGSARTPCGSSTSRPCRCGSGSRTWVVPRAARWSATSSRVG